MRFSVIIPFFFKREAYLKEFLSHMESAESFEVLIAANQPLGFQPPTFARVILTEKISQGEKFDIGAAQATGEILVFVGDDTYPASDWLTKAAAYFADPELVALGGPGLTPPEDSALQKASGFLYESPFAMGPTAFRHSRQKVRCCDDLPGTNLFIRKDAFNQVGGFDNSFCSGEDSYICNKLAKAIKEQQKAHLVEGLGPMRRWKMLFVPDVIVYHHRRNALRGYLRQIWGVGVMRAYFAKSFGGNSRRPTYFAPMVALFLIPALMLLSYTFAVATIIALVAVVASSASYYEGRYGQTGAALRVGLAIPLTYITYGIGFLVGLTLSKDSPRLYHRE